VPETCKLPLTEMKSTFLRLKYQTATKTHPTLPHCEKSTVLRFGRDHSSKVFGMEEGPTPHEKSVTFEDGWRLVYEEGVRPFLERIEAGVDSEEFNRKMIKAEVFIKVYE